MPKQRKMRSYSVVGNLQAFESNPSGLPALPSEWRLTMPLLDSGKRDSHSEPLKSHSGLPHAMTLLRGQRIKAEQCAILPPPTVDHTESSKSHGPTSALKTIFPRLDHIEAMRSPRLGG